MEWENWDKLDSTGLLYRKTPSFISWWNDFSQRVMGRMSVVGYSSESDMFSVSVFDIVVNKILDHGVAIYLLLNCCDHNRIVKVMKD